MDIEKMNKLYNSTSAIFEASQTRAILPRPVSMQQAIGLSNTEQTSKMFSAKLKSGKHTRHDAFYRNLENLPMQVRQMAEHTGKGGRTPRIQSLSEDNRSSQPRNKAVEGISGNVSRTTQHPDLKPRTDAKQKDKWNVRKQVRGYSDTGVVTAHEPAKLLYARKSDPFCPPVGQIPTNKVEPRRSREPKGHKDSLLAISKCSQQMGKFPKRMCSKSLPISIASDYEITEIQDLISQDASTSEGSTPRLNFRYGKIGKEEHVPNDRCAKEYGKPTDMLQKEKQLYGRASYADNRLKDPKNGPRRKVVSDVTPQSLYEMQLRYKNLMQLSKHLKFESSQVMKGERIRKPHSLPSLRYSSGAGFPATCVASNQQDFELFAILSVQQFNEPGLNLSNSANSSSRRSSGCFDGRSTSKSSECTESNDDADHRAGCSGEKSGDISYKENLEAQIRFRKFQEKRSRKRREALRLESDRMLITKAIELERSKETKELTNCDINPKNKVHNRRLRIPPSQATGPSAKVTVSAENPLQKSIEITLPKYELTMNSEECPESEEEEEEEGEDVSGDTSEHDILSNSGEQCARWDMDEQGILRDTAERGTLLGAQEQGSPMDILEQCPLWDTDEQGIFVDTVEQYMVRGTGGKCISRNAVGQDISKHTAEKYPVNTETQDNLSGQCTSDAGTRNGRISSSTGMKTATFTQSNARGVDKTVEINNVVEGTVRDSPYMADFLTVPVSYVTRSISVLSLDDSNGGCRMAIPEIRMICATPLPPGSPE